MKKRYPRGIMATACVPWTEDFRFDETMFRREVDMLWDQGIRSIYLFGTAGEGYIVSNRQFHQITAAFADALRGRDGALPMVGVISLSTDEILQRIEAAAELGIRDFQVSFPSWGAVTESEAVNFLHYVCDRFPELRFMHYNNGMRSKTKLGAAVYARLAEEIPNLVAVKHTAATMAEIADIMKRDLPLQFFFLENAYGYASLMGEASLLISLCNIQYSKAWEYFRAGVCQDTKTLMKLEQELNTCAQALSVLPQGKMDGAYDKLFVKYAIKDFPQRLYPPYEGMTDAQFQQFDTALRTMLPEWFDCASYGHI